MLGIQIMWMFYGFKGQVTTTEVENDYTLYKLFVLSHIAYSLEMMDVPLAITLLLKLGSSHIHNGSIRQTEEMKQLFIEAGRMDGFAAL